MTNPAVQYQKVFKPGSQNDMSLSVKFLVLMTKFHIQHPKSEARRLWFRAHPPLSLFAMPQGQMLTTLKGIAETLLSLLTLLLQVMMHQSEVNPALESEDESPHQSETQAMMNNMMQEPHSQRNLLQEMMNQQNRASRASGRQTGRLS